MQFPQERNDHLVNLLTIARFDATPANRAAVQEELLHGRALLIVQRTTWNEAGAITTVRLACHPGYVMTAAA